MCPRLKVVAQATHWSTTVNGNSDFTPRIGINKSITTRFAQWPAIIFTLRKYATNESKRIRRTNIIETNLLCSCHRMVFLEAQHNSDGARITAPLITWLFSAGAFRALQVRQHVCRAASGTAESTKIVLPSHSGMPLQFRLP
jgi:hypothetical protein